MLSIFAAGVRRPRWACLVIASLVVPALAGIGRLRFEDDYRSLFRADTPAYRLQEQIDAEFGREDNDVYVLLRSRDFRAPGEARRLAALHHGLESVDGVAAVYSLASLPEVALALRLDDDGLARRLTGVTDWPLARRRLLSGDGTVALAVARLGGESLSLARLDPLMERIGEVARAHDGIVTGIPELRREIVGTLRREWLRMNLVAVVLVSVISLLIFRHPLALLIAGTGPLLGVGTTLGLMGWLGEPINLLNILVPQLVLVIALTDSIHLLHHARRCRAAGTPRREAAVDAILRVGPACLMTSLTTAAGFASLYLARIDLVRRYGMTCAAGTLAGYVAVMAVVPLLTTTRLGRWLERPAELGRIARFGDRLAALVAPVLARPAITVAGSCVLMMGLLVLAAGVRPDHRFTESLPDGSPLIDAIALQDEVFGGSAPLVVRVAWPAPMSIDDATVQGTLAQAASALARHAGASAPTSVLDFAAGSAPGSAPLTSILARLPQDIVDRWIDGEHGAALVAGFVPDDGSAALLPRLEALRAAVGRIAEDTGLRLDVTGLSALSAEGTADMMGDLSRSLGGALLVIVLIIAVALRSLRLGLVCLLPNLLPLAAAVAALRLASMPLQYASLGVLTIGLGLAVDDTIHFLTALARQEGARRAAVFATVRQVGIALVTTTALLVGSLAGLLFSPMPTIRTFGWLLGLLLVLALLADLTVLPALMLLRETRGAVSWVPEEAA